MVILLGATAGATVGCKMAAQRRMKSRSITSRPTADLKLQQMLEDGTPVSVLHVGIEAARFATNLASKPLRVVVKCGQAGKSTRQSCMMIPSLSNDDNAAVGDFDTVLRFTWDDAHKPVLRFRLEQDTLFNTVLSKAELVIPFNSDCDSAIEQDILFTKKGGCTSCEEFLGQVHVKLHLRKTTLGSLRGPPRPASRGPDTRARPHHSMPAGIKASHHLRCREAFRGSA
mmetsp:Transcript_81105/g.133978  ORF Transcript_81105/g.133978 Transcript_81105/m.133978 type:complete len:228 (+) Transcript_81105:65-748(+)